MLICSSCGNENPEGATFCNACAAPLAEQPSPAAEERKIVSVLFCDLVGFTAASEQQDPEDVRARIRPYHARLREEIERYDGTVEKFVGDAVMAVFGAPVAHEDDAERAVRAGIGTGEAVVSVGARPEQGEGIVTGDVVNTAARIQTAAPVNGVAVSEQTHRATSRVFEYESLAPVTVKGKAEPLSLWRPKAARVLFGRDVNLEYKTPFVGRELEKPLLIGTFERAAQQRTVQLVTIVGEPGVGKSRLAAELFAYVDAKPELIRWRQGRCLPYGEGITFWALGEIVKAEAGILESDSSEVAATKLEAAVSAEESERQWLLQRLAPLVGLEAASPAERQELFTAWRRFFEGLAAAGPSVLVFEDLHWADEALLAFLEYLAEWSQGVPLLVLCAARPELYERRPGWGAGQRNAHTINLSPLSDRETAELVSSLATTTTVLSEELERAILERAGGNPLYAEEFVRLLADRGPGQGGDGLAQAALPESVQALIAARLDTLNPERKSLLQDAAVVVKVFWAGALAEIGARAAGEVEIALHELSRKELVRPARTSSMEGETEYSFWHVLVRDVAYGQVPRAERARRHRSAAVWIERKAGERVEDLAEVLAYHYLEALELTEAAGGTEQAEELAVSARRFLALAGERALGLDTAQAEARLARALELTPADDPEWPELLVRWADAALQAGRSREAADALDLALASLRDRGETETAARALQVRSRVALRRGDSRMWLALAAEAVALLEPERPRPALVDAYAQLASAHAIAGAYAEAIAAADRASVLAGTLGLPEPARALGYRGYARVWLGDADGLVEPAGVLNANCSALLAELGRTEEALARAGQLAAVAEASGDDFILLEHRSVELANRFARGEREEVRLAVDWLIEAGRALGTAEMIVVALSPAAAALAAEEPERASALLAELEQVAGARKTPYYARELAAMVRTALAAGDSALAKRLAHRLEPRYPLDEHALCAARAQLAEHAGEHPDAAALYAEAAVRWEQFGNVPERALALLGEGRCLAALGRPEAQEPLRQARNLFASMGYKPVLAETDALLEQTAAAPTS